MRYYIDLNKRTRDKREQLNLLSPWDGWTAEDGVRAMEANSIPFFCRGTFGTGEESRETLK